MVGNNIVCNIFELVHFLEEGSVQINNNQYSLWSGPQLTANDLIRYLGENSFIISRINLLKPSQEEYKLDSNKLIIHKFELDENQYVQDCSNLFDENGHLK